MPSVSNACCQTAARPSWLELLVLKLMRIGIGWHFAYEGLTKLLDPTWTARGYLENANWIGAEAFHWMAANPTILSIVDGLNAWGLFAIGVGLILGCFTRLAAIPASTHGAFSQSA
jgi:thiosulfate dehydrogenase [quinone] large subunit